MKKQDWMRAIAAMLLAALTVVQVGCVRENPNEDESKVSDTVTSQLVIETPPAVYSEAFLADILPRTAELCGRLLRLGEGLVLGETQTQKMTEFLSARVFPMLLEIPVYDTELTQLIEKAETLCDQAEASREDWAFLSLQLYQNMQTVLDAPRAGAIIYRSTLLWMGESIALCEERYEKYGNEWDLEDAEAYRALQARVENEIGETCYTSMIEMLIFSLNAVAGAFPAEQETDGFNLSNDELLMLMQRQADVFRTRSVTAAQWSLFGELFSHWILAPNGSIGREELTALNKDGYFKRAFQVMPSLLELYVQAVNSMNGEQLGKLRSGDADMRASVIGQVLSACETQFFAWSEAMQMYFAIETEAEAKVLRKAGLYEDFEDFCDEYPAVNADTLWNTLTDDGIEANRLHCEIVGYLRGIAPYVTFVAEHLRTVEKGEKLC